MVWGKLKEGMSSGHKPGGDNHGHTYYVRGIKSMASTKNMTNTVILQSDRKPQVPANSTYINTKPTRIQKQDINIIGRSFFQPTTQRPQANLIMPGNIYIYYTQKQESKGAKKT